MEEMSLAFAGFSFSFSFFLGDFPRLRASWGRDSVCEHLSRSEGVKEMRRLEFGTKLDTVPLNGLY